MGGLPTKQQVVAFAADPTKNPVMFAALLDGPWKSWDAGNTWQRLDNMPGITALAVHPRKPELVFAGTGDGKIFQSTDGGGSWQVPR